MTRGNQVVGRKCGVLVGLGWYVAAGCAQRTVPDQFVADVYERDYHCAEVTVKNPAPGRYEVTGCGAEAIYDCDDTACVMHARADERGTSTAADLTPHRADSPSTLLSQDIRVETVRGEARLILDMRLDRSSILHVTGVPDRSQDVVQLKVVRRDSSEANDKCELRFLVDSQELPSLKTVTSRGGYMLSQRVQVGPDVMQRLANAEKVAFRACDQRWALTRYQVQRVRDYMDRFEEEREWKSKPRDDPNAGMQPPADGWPSWSARGTPPPPQTAVLDAPSLFKLLKPSVFQVEATRSKGVSQGSAVAISADELITNCHVLQGARTIAVKQGTQQWAGRLEHADPKADRCVIRVPDAKLTPIVSVRSFASLEVGETVYTLGSPVGLELTLSNGIVSGRREEGAMRFVQTTAPISPGPSGGGLFDARGNLIGITTLAIVGRERLNQALNFAIPAETFWQ